MMMRARPGLPSQGMPEPRPARRRTACAVILVGILALSASAFTGCTVPPPDGQTGPPQKGGIPTTPAPGFDGEGPVAPSGEYTVIATGLRAPWSIVPLDDGRALLSYRDEGKIVLMSQNGSVSDVGTVDGVVAQGEGGLLGLALLPNDDETAWLYAYLTGSDDNRVVRYEIDLEASAPELGERETIVTGIPKAGNHNGGRIAFGPDGMLYVTAGDAGNGNSAQDPASLSGKILRFTPTGGIPDDNPRSGLAMFSMGHRNPQGIVWDADGRLWSSEFGQNAWDELNVIEAGANYGWPVVEGIAGDTRFVDPAYQWTTSEASPSGLTIVDNTLFMAALRGERLWSMLDGVHVPEDSHGLEGAVSASAYFEGEFGRIRDVVPGPDGTLWLITNNTDGRGSPGPDDDRLIEVQLNIMREG